MGKGLEPECILGTTDKSGCKLAAKMPPTQERFPVSSTPSSSRNQDADKHWEPEIFRRFHSPEATSGPSNVEEFGGSSHKKDKLYAVYYDESVDVKEEIREKINEEKGEEDSKQHLQNLMACAEAGDIHLQVEEARCHKMEGCHLAKEAMKRIKKLEDIIQRMQATSGTLQQATVGDSRRKPPESSRIKKTARMETTRRRTF